MRIIAAGVEGSEMVADLWRVVGQLNHTPSSVENRKHGHYNLRSAQRRFKTFWASIIKRAGLRYTARTSRRIPSTEELRRDVRLVTLEVGHTPARSGYEVRGSFCSETVRKRSGQRKWEHAPTTGESNAGGINGQRLCLRVGGKWVDILEAAGIDLRSRSKYAILRLTTTQELTEDVMAVSRRLGRPARVREYEARGRYPYTAIRGRVGGWRQVKKVVVEKLREERGLAEVKRANGSLHSNSTVSFGVVML